MRSLPPIDSDETFRVRRWDAVILGSALPGLITAIRLGMQGIRVLIIEESAAASGFPGLREPFLMAGSGSTGVLGECLTGLGIPLIERRRLRSIAPAFQVAFPGARADVGDSGTEASNDWTVEELETWGLSSRSVAQELVASLREDAETEQKILLGVAPSPSGTRLSRAAKGASEWKTLILAERQSSTTETNPYTARYEKPLATFLDAQVRALSDFAEKTPTAAVQSRLLGSVLDGAAEFDGGFQWLRELLEERIRSLYGEFRRVSTGFKLVLAGDQPAVELKDPAGICAGRALILNAPLAALRDLMEPSDDVPDLLKGPSPSHRRLTVHLRGARRLVPEAMATRVIQIGDPDREISGTNLVRLRTFISAQTGDRIDLVASAVIPAAADIETAGEEIEEAVAKVLPLGREGWQRVKPPQARWDRDEWLADPTGTSGNPGDGLLRPVPRLPAFVLDRAHSGALGFEGELLLGWRAGDAIAAELS